MKKANKTFINELLSVILIVMFLHTGLSKLLDKEKFISELYKSPLVPEVLIPVIAIGLPVVEIIIATMLLIKKYQFYGFYLSLLMMLFFTSYLLVLVSFFDSTKIPCACGGIFGNLSYSAHIIVNVVLAAMSAYGYSRESAFKETSHLKDLQ